MSELSEMILKLDQLCKKHGPRTPLGARYSKLSQQAQNYVNSDDPAQKQALADFMANTQAEIARIIKDDGEYIPEHHTPTGPSILDEPPTDTNQ